MSGRPISKPDKKPRSLTVWLRTNARPRPSGAAGGAIFPASSGGSLPPAGISSYRAVLSLVAVTGLALVGCLSLLAVRVVVMGDPFYLFLGSNLLLACIPIAMATVQLAMLRGMAPCRGRSILIAACAVIWLLFYPNAPYLFTDFIHIVEKTWIRSDPSDWLGVRGLLWYDIVMSAAFAFVGHFLGLLSMWVEGRVLDYAWGKSFERAYLALAVLLAGFGVYLGRFARLNSWDAILTPIRTIQGTLDALADPKAILFSLAFSFFVAVTYGMMGLAFSLRDPPRK
jgi:uncharacterized membrane protein